LFSFIPATIVFRDLPLIIEIIAIPPRPVASASLTKYYLNCFSFKIGIIRLILFSSMSHIRKPPTLFLCVSQMLHIASYLSTVPKLNLGWILLSRRQEQVPSAGAGKHISNNRTKTALSPDEDEAEMSGIFTTSVSCQSPDDVPMTDKNIAETTHLTETTAEIGQLVRLA
jgi:hypothetical protein